MKKIIAFFLVLTLSQAVWSQQKNISITGQVTDGIEVLSDVNITIEGSEKRTRTNSEGRYTLSVSQGNRLKFSHIGYDPIEIVTEDIDRTLNIVMNRHVEVLDDVTVVKKRKKRRSQEQLFSEYNFDPNLIKTQFGIIDKKRFAAELYILDGDDISASALNILTVIQGKFPGVRVNLTSGTVIVRGLGSIINPRPAIYDVDGNLFTEAPLFINPQNIERIGLLPSISASARYGSLAAGGVIVINLKSGNFSPTFLDRALAKNNDFKYDLIDYEVLAKNGPTYLTELRQSQGLDEAKVIYEKYLKRYKSSEHFVLDTYQYFFNEEESHQFADDIIKTHKGLFENNPIALKALAYMYQFQGRLKRANLAYKELFILRPNYSQSYSDLANSYREEGRLKEAVGLYARYAHLLNEGFMLPEQNFDAIMNREYNNLLNTEGSKLISKRARKNLAQNVENINTRLVFEWSDSEAEFELQFVNPKGKYVKMEHSLFADAEIIRSQKIAGYAMQEHLIDDTFLGKWQVNAKYLGNKSLTPTYLKATVYHNYGSTSQRKEVKLFKLTVKNVNQKLFTVINEANIVSN